jgi:cell division protease FtsH
MDGFDTRQGVILIAATNRPDILDPALLRPGRFDRQVTVDRPDKGGRRRILEVHAEGKPLHAAVSLEVLAKRTPGFTGADLANLLNEAALLTARRNLRQIGMRECEEAIDRVLAGPERTTLVLSDHDKAVTAYHEAGHVIVGHVLPHADPVHKVSIVARSRSLGLTFTLPEDKFNHSRSELRDRMAMCLGGRSAEELVFDEQTTGAENDIEKATGLARAMVTEYGMSDRLGPQQLAQPTGEVFLGREMGSQSHLSDEITAVIDAEVRGLIDEAHDRARTILETHAGTLEALAQALIEAETLDTPELMAIIGGLPSWTGLPPLAEPGAPLAEPGAALADDRGVPRLTRSGRPPRTARTGSEAVAAGEVDPAGVRAVEEAVTRRNDPGPRRGQQRSPKRARPSDERGPAPGRRRQAENP